LRSVQGHRQFEQLTVTPEWIEDPRGLGGPRQFVHVVRGLYWDGRRAKGATGGDTAEWRPAFFVAPVPYRPRVDLSVYGTKGPAAAARLAAVKEPTVLDFLAAAREAADVQYDYAWYRGSAYARWMWVGGCVMVFGVAIPVVINLTVYGTVWRPRRRKEEGTDLSKVSVPPAAEKKPLVTDDDLAAVAELNGQLEDQIGAGAASGTEAGARTETAVPVLSGGPVETSTVDAPHDPKAFGVEKDDFYPTERHARH
jgi:hypothetical protein